MTQEQLVDICRLMDINKDGLVDLNEFLESFRLAEKSLRYEENEYAEMQATWQELDRRHSRTAVDKDETGVEVEILNMGDDKAKAGTSNKNGHTQSMGIIGLDADDIALIDCEHVRRPGLLESDMWLTATCTVSTAPWGNSLTVPLFRNTYWRHYILSWTVKHL